MKKIIKVVSILFMGILMLLYRNDSIYAEETSKPLLGTITNVTNITHTVPTPYDDLSDRPCNGSSEVTCRISTAAGVNATAMWVLSGDTVEYIGVIKGCQVEETPGEQLSYGFEATELEWRLRLVGQTIAEAESITSGIETIQSGRTTIPSQQRLKRVATKSDEGARLFFGAFNPVDSPNGSGTLSGTSSILMHVVEPQLTLVKEVCTLDTASECDVNDDSVWGTSRNITSGDDVFWRLTATNKGNSTLKNVKVKSDILSNGTSTTNTIVGATIAETLEPNESVSVVFKSSEVDSDGMATNTAKLTSDFVDPSPGQTLLSRFPNGVESNESSAYVQVTPAAVDPIIKKSVDGKASKDLINQKDLFTWEIATSFGNDTSDWTKVMITDQINELLDIKDIRIVDENNNDVTSKGTLDTTNNIVTFTLNQENGSFTYLVDHTYTMYIGSQIKSSATAEDLSPYIKEGGIPNQATLAFGDGSQTIVSEQPRVNLPVNSITKKTIDGSEKKILENRNLPNTGDESNVIGLSILLLGTGSMLLFISKIKNKKITNFWL